MAALDFLLILLNLPEYYITYFSIDSILFFSKNFDIELVEIRLKKKMV